MPPKRNRKGKEAAAPLLPFSPDFVQPHELLVERGAGSVRGKWVINSLRGAAGHLLHREALEFYEQVESWPYLFWPPLPQWYILPFEKGSVAPDNMVHDMNTSERLEQFAVSGLFSNTGRPHYAGNLFYTNIIIPLFHACPTNEDDDQEAAGGETVTIWSFLHFSLKQAEDGDVERDDEELTRRVYWHVLTKWHADKFEQQARDYVSELTIDGILDGQKVFPPEHEFVVCHNVGPTDTNIPYHDRAGVDLEQYGQDSFLFCLLSIAHLALEMNKDPSEQDKLPFPFGLQSLALRQGEDPGVAAPDQVDVTDKDRASTILLLGIRDVFQHSRVRLTDPGQAEAAAGLDLDAIPEEPTNSWAKASAEWVRSMVENLRLSAKITFGGPYESVDAAGEEEDDDNGDDNGGQGPSGSGGNSCGGNDGGHGSSSGGGGASGENKNSGEGASGSGGNSGSNTQTLSAKQRGKLPEGTQARAEGSLSSKLSGAEPVPVEQGRKRRRSKDSLFSESDEEEEEPATKKQKPEEGEAALEEGANEEAGDEISESSEEWSTDEDDEEEEEDEEEEDEVEAEYAEMERFRVEVDCTKDTYAAERMYHYVLSHKPDKHSEYLPEYNMLYSSI